jgi:hypothetical protein
MRVLEDFGRILIPCIHCDPFDELALKAKSPKKKKNLHSLPPGCSFSNPVKLYTKPLIHIQLSSGVLCWEISSLVKNGSSTLSVLEDSDMLDVADYLVVKED